MNRSTLSLILWMGSALPLIAQTLRPGFDREEYKEMIRLAASHRDTIKHKGVTAPIRFVRKYRSPILGLDNRWDLWMLGDTLAVVSIRGTTRAAASWLENFYAAMVPAMGTLPMPDGTTFPYKLADNPRAGVHVGWLFGMASLAPGITHKIDSLHKRGLRQLIITGHSQGGAIATLLTSYFRYQSEVSAFKPPLTIKTYSSASPKPGNVYFAYDYEAGSQGGWAYTVVNTADWVPEVPVSIQKLSDFNATNPFRLVENGLSDQPFPRRLVLRQVYRGLDRSTIRAERRYRRYLGKYAAKYVQKYAPGYEPPALMPSLAYARCGPTVILQADSAYYKLFPDSDTQDKVFTHHLFAPYMYLADKLGPVR